MGSFVDTLTGLGMPASIPEGGFYVLADVGSDATEWCERMLVDQGVAGLPLSVFYSEPVPEAAGMVRFALCKQPGTLAEASRRLRPGWPRARRPEACPSGTAAARRTNSAGPGTRR